jgi:hypothetical protein
MRTVLLLPIIMAFCLFNIKLIAQDQPPPQGQQQQPDQLNLPGDNLNLYAVMKIFQESPTLEEFEKKLNDPNQKINNLDLNGDNQIDYIKVIDKQDGDTHNIALKVAINQNEDQDVAVFFVKKDNNGQVIIQLIGDEALYGKNYIIEPNSGSSTPTPNPGYTGDQPPPPPVDGGDVYAASSWPVVQYLYVPTYSPWASPWGWGYYPSYWQPWTPLFWHEYYGYQYHWNYYYRAHYRYTPVYRYPAWHDRYYGGGYRSTSTFVSVHINQNYYRQTYSRPDLANRGADLFRADHPNAPRANKPLPQFDNNNNGRPIVNRNRQGQGFGNNNNNNPGRVANTTPVNNNGNNNGYNRPNRNYNAAPANNNGNNANNNGNNRPNRNYNAAPANNGNNNAPNRMQRPVNTAPSRPVNNPPAQRPQQARPAPAPKPANDRPGRHE